MSIQEKKYRYIDAAAIAAQNGDYTGIDEEGLSLPWEMHYVSHTVADPGTFVSAFGHRSGKRELLLIDDAGRLWCYYSDIGRIQATRLQFEPPVTAVEWIAGLVVVRAAGRVEAYAPENGQIVWHKTVPETALMRKADSRTLLLYDPGTGVLSRLNGGGETVTTTALQKEATHIAGFDGASLCIAEAGQSLRIDRGDDTQAVLELAPDEVLLSAEMTGESALALLLFDQAKALNTLRLYRYAEGGWQQEDTLLLRTGSLRSIRRDCLGQLWYLSDTGTLGYARQQRQYLPLEAPLLLHVDALVYATRWHRMIVDYDLPDECVLRIDAAAAEEALEPLDDAFVPAAPLQSDLLLPELKGRHLYLRLYLTGDQAHRSSPVIRSLSLTYPRSTYLEHLPAYYRESPEHAAVLERFFSIFETVFSDLEARREATPSLIDSAETPEAQLAWLSGWLGLDCDDRWDPEKWRALMHEAPKLFGIRGTREAIERIIEIYSGRRPLIYEPLHTRCRDDGVMKTMDNYSFCLFLSPDHYHTTKEVDTIRRIVDEWKPAYTRAQVVPLEHRIILGSHLFLGINTRLERHKEHLGEARMPFDGVAEARSEDSRSLERVRIGHDAVLH